MLASKLRGERGEVKKEHRLNKALLATAAIKAGDEVDVVVRDGALIVTPVRRVRGGHNLEELVRRIPKGSRGRELEWGQPVLVVSNDLFNTDTGLCLTCPITKYRSWLAVSCSGASQTGVTSYIMVEQVKSMDFRSRKAKRAGVAPAAVLDQMLSLLDACIY